MESGILRTEASSWSKAAAGWGAGFMIHNRAVALNFGCMGRATLAALLLGSLFFVISNG
jgi:hypothetical protein